VRQIDLSNSLSRLQREIDFQQRSFDALLSIAEAAGDNPSVETVFQTAIKALRAATEYESIGMRLYDKENRCLPLIVHYGISQSMMEVLDSIPDDRGFQAEVIRNKLPSFSSDLATDPRLVAKTALDLGYRSFICIPLLAGNKILGTMEMVTTHTVDWDESKVAWYALIGRSIGTMINNVQLTERLRDLSVLQERTRLAQEIHDGLAQSLSSLRIWAEEAQISLDEGNSLSVQIAIRKIQTASKDACASLRGEMLGLRETFVPGEDFIPVLAECLSRFQRQWGIQTCLQLQLPSDGSRLKISPSAEVQLLRIVQEALMNIHRHAQATQVQISFGEGDGRVQVRIADNGNGFDPSLIRQDQFGLRIMHERAASVGGSIVIRTEPGEGTVLIVELSNTEM
jgi:nitrate/nitrite-specific signal transduction histidine kinase